MIDDRISTFECDETDVAASITPVLTVNLADLASDLWDISDFEQCGTPDCACHNDCND
jgi:hypothetical protein